MTATGASQTPLEGNALASGCAGCDGDGIYATITKVLFNANWFDGASDLIVEDNYVEISAGEYSRQLVVYANYPGKAPKQISADKLSFAIDGDGLSVDAKGMISGSANGGQYTITVTAAGKEDLKGAAIIMVA